MNGKGEIVRTETILRWLSVTLILSLAVLQAPAFAQEATRSGVVSKSKLHIYSSVRVGDTLLKAGMYQVQHVMEGDNHMLIFNEIRMGYGSNMGNQALGEEVARVTSTVEPAAKKWRNTGLVTRKDEAGKQVAVKVQIGGETITHKVERSAVE
jgi:hypothetical protein